MTPPASDRSDKADPVAAEWRTFSAATLMGLLIIIAALLLAEYFHIDVAPLLKPSFGALAAGVVATLPLIAALEWLMRTREPHFAKFRQSQIEYFADIGFAFTPVRIGVLALVAGVGEEILFRGVLQTVVDREASLAAAIILPNILFGALHARTALYAAIAGGVGVYFGLLFAFAGGLFAAIIAHAVYDAYALHRTGQAIAAKAREEV